MVRTNQSRALAACNAITNQFHDKPSQIIIVPCPQAAPTAAKSPVDATRASSVLH